MAKPQAQTTVADSNDAVQDEPTGPKFIAEWTGSDLNPRIDGRTARTISKKEAKDGLIMDLTRDLRWGPETAYRADVTAEVPAFREWLVNSKEFKITEE